MKIYLCKEKLLQVFSQNSMYNSSTLHACIYIEKKIIVSNTGNAKYLAFEMYVRKKILIIAHFGYQALVRKLTKLKEYG